MKYSSLAAFASSAFFLCFMTAVPAKAATNLIVNPSVESASADPTVPFKWAKAGFGSNARSYLYPVEGYGGDNAAGVAITEYAGGAARWEFAEVPVTPGLRYTFSDFYRSDTNSILKVRYRLSNGTFKFAELGTLGPTQDWRNAHRSFVVPAGATMATVYHSIESVGFLTSDSYALFEDPLPTNLVKNAQFVKRQVSGDPTDWFRGGYGNNARTLSLEDCPYYSGVDDSPRAAQPACPANTEAVLFQSISSHASGDSKWYFRDIQLGTTRNFKATFDYQAVTDDAKLVVRFTYPNGNNTYHQLGGMARPAAVNGYTPWQTMTQNVVAPPTATYMTLFFALHGTGELRVANVFMTRGGDNLIANPSMDISARGGEPSRWDKGGSGTNTRTHEYPVPGPEDLKAGRVTIADYIDGNAQWQHEPVPVTGGTRYFFSDAYRSTGTVSEVGARFSMANGSTQYKFLAQLTPNANWRIFNGSFTAPANAVSAVMLHSIHGNGLLEVDDYSLVPN